MNPSSDGKPEARARIGVGASVGTVIGALLAQFIYNSSTAVIIGSIIGAALGAAVGTRLRSQAFQFIWIEYSKEVGIRIVVSFTVFTALFLGFFFLSSKSSTSLVILILLLVATLIGLLFAAYSIYFAIAQLDDVLRNVQKEAAVIAFCVSLFIFFTLGMVNQIYPIPSHWLFPFILMMFSFLIGRLVVGWKYR